MKPLSLRLAVLAGLLATIPVGGQEEPTAYLCIADEATGFSYNETRKAWVKTSFDVSSHKYIVKKNPDASTGVWDVTNFGDSVPFAQCDGLFTSPTVLDCGTRTPIFRLNLNNLRYLSGYLYGYFDSGTDTLPDTATSYTPLIEIGKCSPL